MAKPVFYRKALSPAKLNLILRIGPKRQDGYHELETLMVPLTWGDSMRIRISSSDRFECQIHCPSLKLSQKKNLVYRAAEMFSKHFKIPVSLRVDLEKKIPTGAGLGGGSGNAATLLKILRDWAISRGHSKSRIQRALPSLAAKLGADIPFFLFDSAAWCTGFGEKCNPVPLKSYAVVVLMPQTKIATPWAYHTLDFERSKSKKRGSRFEGMPVWLNESCAIPALENDFESLALKYKPALHKCLRLLAESQALASRMSGSGSAFFGIFENIKSATKAARFIRSKGVRAIACETISSIKP